MSQAGLIDIESSHPQIPTQFDTDSGSAVPLANVLEILGSTVANATNAQTLFTTGSGNTVTAEIQVGVALAAADITRAGVVTFDNTDFAVDSSTGHVTLTGAGAGQTITGDSGGALSPTAGNWDILGGTGMTTAGAGSALTLNATVAGSGVYADNAIIRGDGGGPDIQDSGVIINDSDQVSGATRLDVDNIRLDGNTISTTDAAGDLLLSPATTGGVVVPGSLTAGESVKDVDFTINGVAISATIALHTSGASDLGGFASERHTDTAAFGAHSLFLRSRGAEGAPTVVADNDAISRLVSSGYDGTDFAQSAEIRVEVDGTPGADDMPGRILLMTSVDGTQTPIEALRVDSNQETTLANPLAVTSGGTGVGTLTDGGIILGSGTADVTVTAQPTNGQLLIGSTGVDPVLASLTVLTVANATNATPLFVDEGAGTLNIDLQVAAAVTGAPGDKNDAGISSYNDVFYTSDTDGYTTPSSNWEETGMHGWNGASLESANVDVTSDGATITLAVEQEGGGDLTVVFSDGYYVWDTTPADTVALTPGTDTVPVLNYVYLLQSNKTLTASTVGFPSAEHSPVATVLCQTASLTQTDGPYKVHAWTDHVVSLIQQGHVQDLNFWVRQQPATWVSGVTQTYTITPNGGAADNVILTTASGVVLQLHEHTFPAFAGTPDLYVVNDSATAFTKVTDLNALLTDSTGASMSGRYFSLVIWGCVSEDTGDCKLFVNLPGGSYNNQSGVLDDVDAFSNYTIPTDFRGTGFLISEWKLRHQAAASGTWTSIDEINLLGLFPSLAAGGTPGSIVFTTDSGVATPASNNLNILGSTVANATNAQPLFTTGSGATVTAEIQVGVAVTGAPADTNDAGIVSFDDTAFAVDANGYVTLAGGAGPAVDTFTVDQNGPVVPTAAGVVTVTGTSIYSDGVAANTITLNVQATAETFLVGAGAGSTATELGPLTDGQLIIGATAGAPAASTLTAGTGIGITNGTNAITINAVGGGFTWNDVTGTSDSFVASNGYITNNVALVTITLPATCAVGDSFRIAGLGAGGWKVAQNASQLIHFGNMDTTTGVGGSLASSDRYDCLEFLCVVTNNEYLVLSGVGNITVT